MTGRQYTYEMAYGMSKKFGSALLRMGAKKGDVMGMVVPNIPEFPIAYLGAAGVGVTLTTMNPTYRPGMTSENEKATFKKPTRPQPNMWSFVSNQVSYHYTDLRTSVRSYFHSKKQNKTAL